MKLKFKTGAVVIVDGKEYIVKVGKKDFSNNSISYRMVTGELFQEKQLSTPAVETGQKQKAQGQAKGLMEGLHQKYEKTFHKAVPSNKKNNTDWIKLKLEEATTPSKTAKDPDEILNAMDEAQLKEFIQTKELEIDPEDFGDKKELIKAICEELGV